MADLCVLIYSPVKDSFLISGLGPRIDASASPGLAGVSSTLASDALAEAFDETAFDEYFGLLALDDLVVVRPYNGDDDDRVLEELRPRWVVMYEPDAAFVRRIEVRRRRSSFNVSKRRADPGGG